MVASETALQMPPALGEKWAEGLKRNARLINERRKARIPHGEAFTQRVAGPSSKAYRQIFNPDFVSRAGLSAKDIVNRQAANLGQSFEKYNQGLDFVYRTEDGVEAKRFKERVEAGRKHYEQGAARKTMPFTGTPGSRGPIALAGLWLTDDPIAEGEIRGMDEIVEGNPVLITKRAARASFKAALGPRLQQAGAAIVNSNFDAAIMQEHNDITNGIVQGFLDETLGLVEFTTGGDSHVDYSTKLKGVFCLDIQVAQK